MISQRKSVIRHYKEEVMEKAIRTIFTQNEIDRITSKIRNGEPTVTVDVHGMTVKDARRMLLNLLAMDREGYDLRVIHGYNRGTAIKDMIRDDLPNPRVVGKIEPPHNPGETLLVVRKAA